MNDYCTGKGTYIIVLYVTRARSIQIGKLGRLRFKKGYYAYVGSAFGPGGLGSRLRHHLLPKKRAHWHMDYLDFPVKEIWVSEEGEALEHHWAVDLEEMASDRMSGFGCSDCRCSSHLFYFRQYDLIRSAREKLCGSVYRARWANASDFKSRLEKFPRIFRLSSN